MALGEYSIDDVAPFAGGRLHVSAGGRFSYDGWTHAGRYRFTYQLENSSGSANAQLELLIPGPPVAVDDDAEVVLSPKVGSYSFNFVSVGAGGSGILVGGAGIDGTGFYLDDDTGVGCTVPDIASYGGIDFGSTEEPDTPIPLPGSII